MNDDALLSRLASVTDEQAAAMVSRQALGELAEDIIVTAAHRPPAELARKPARHDSRTRPRRWLPLAVGAAVAAGAAVTVGVIVSAGQPAPGGKVAQNTISGPAARPTQAVPSAAPTLDAWTVTENRDGTVRVTIREMKDPAGLQAKLRADGVRVVVTASLAWPAACSEWRGGNYRMGDRVLQNLNRTGLPSANGTEFVIRPSAIPAAALLWLGVTQTGKPNGVVGPPGPLGAGYLTASRACAQS
jgi:hypothetical protein